MKARILLLSFFFVLSITADELENAFESCNCDLLKDLVLVQRMNINTQYEHGRTLLHRAILNNSSADFIQFLLDIGADPTISDENDEIPLQLLLDREVIDPELVRILIREPRMGQFTDNLGNTVLHIMAQTNMDPEIFRIAIDIHPDLINTQNTLGHTPLHAAAATNAVSNLRMLLAARANPNILDIESNAPALAAGIENPEIVGLLLNAGTDPNIQVREGNQSVSLLRMAFQTEDINVINLFLRSPQLIPNFQDIQDLLNAFSILLMQALSSQRHMLATQDMERRLQGLELAENADDQDTEQEQSEAIERLTNIIILLLNIGAQIPAQNLAAFQSFLPAELYAVITNDTTYLNTVNPISYLPISRLAIGQTNAPVLQMFLPYITLDDILPQFFLMERVQGLPEEIHARLNNVRELLLNRAISDNNALRFMAIQTQQSRSHSIMHQLLVDHPIYSVPFAQEVAARLINRAPSTSQGLERSPRTIESFIQQFITGGISQEVLIERLTRMSLIPMLINNWNFIVRNIVSSHSLLERPRIIHRFNDLIFNILLHSAQLGDQQTIITLIRLHPQIILQLMKNKKWQPILDMLIRHRYREIAAAVEQQATELIAAELQSRFAMQDISDLQPVIQDPHIIRYFIDNFTSYNGPWREYIEASIITYLNNHLHEDISTIIRQPSVRQIIHDNNLWQQLITRAQQAGNMPLASQIQQLFYGSSSFRLPSFTESFGMS